MQGTLYFGSSYMPSGTFYPMLTEPLFRRCTNPERIYGMVAFDTWICNRDRHEGNLLVRRIRQRGASPEELRLLLNDHSHCLVLPQGQAPNLAASLTAPAQDFVSIQYIRDAVTDVQALAEWCDTVEAVSDAEILAFVRELPSDLLSAADRPHYEDFLVARKSRLRQALKDGQSAFSNLQGVLS
jgi:hypothetical protein